MIPGKTTSPSPSMLPRPGPGKTSLMGASRCVATVIIMGLELKLAAGACEPGDRNKHTYRIP